MWFRVDDYLWAHPKARKAGMNAMGLWVLAGSYSARYGLDGHVPRSFVVSLGLSHGSRVARRLVDAGLWEQNEDGWVFRDWEDYQVPADKVKQQKKLNRERAQRWRDNHRGEVW